MYDKVLKNEFGFYEIKNKPDQAALDQYYRNKYFQSSETNTYSRHITEEEKQYKTNKIEQRHQYLLDKGLLEEGVSYKFLDVGCGEGFSLDFFRKKAWEVLGLDYSSYACRHFHPECLPYMREGNVEHNLLELIEKGQTFDLVWLDNVLEHVIDPEKLLIQLHKLGRHLVVEVPNDFSAVQERLIEMGKIEQPFWVSPPDHLSYFNREGLVNICEATGWKVNGVISDFPIDWYLFNDFSNYNRDKSTGKQAHYSRVELDNLMHRISPSKTNALYESMADLGLGRQIVVFLQSNPK